MKIEDTFDIVYFLRNERNGLACCLEGKSIMNLFEFPNQYVKQIIPNYPQMVCIQIIYDEDTLLPVVKGQYLKHGSVAVGLWEYYDEDGHLDHVVNMDEHFPITWPKLEQILKDKDISLLTADSIYRYYDEVKDTATWSIVIKLPKYKGCLYVFDGCTGELIKEEIIDMTMEL